MTKEELEKATGQELIEQRNYCGVDGYYGDYILDVNAEMLKRFNRLVELEKKNAELKAKVGLSIDCEKAQKSGELCLGYGCDEDEPCEQCKNCIKCEGGYYQLGETEKDEQLTKAKEIIRELLDNCFGYNSKTVNYEVKVKAEQFLKEIEK